MEELYSVRVIYFSKEEIFLITKPMMALTMSNIKAMTVLNMVLPYPDSILLMKPS